MSRDSATRSVSSLAAAAATLDPAPGDVAARPLADSVNVRQMPDAVDGRPLTVDGAVPDNRVHLRTDAARIPRPAPKMRGRETRPMLDRLIIRNFKQFEDVEVELGQAVVFVGPNNSGKTTALQAIALWERGVRRWSEKRGGQAPPTKRPGVTLTRHDLVALPVPETNLLWRDLRLRQGRRLGGRQKTENIRVDIELHGVHDRLVTASHSAC